jgi:prepilin signal peptidase PulO-like enzyme (type II secretory pathway)
MAGLLNIVPRYLPRYGMAPDWTRATRPLVIVFTTIAFAVTIIFRASVEAQAGAYATGVLVLITSAAVAVTLATRSAGQRAMTAGFALIAAVFAYTPVVNIFERPDGLKIASLFIGAIVIVSLISRTVRSVELRAYPVEFDETAIRFIEDAARHGTIRIIANHPDERNTREYLLKERKEREASNIPVGAPVLFLEVSVRDASEFASRVEVRGESIGGFHVLRADGAAIPNAIAAVLLAIRDLTATEPHAYFGWVEGNPLRFLGRFVFFGEGDIAPVTHEILRKAEPNLARRPVIHVG